MPHTGTHSVVAGHQLYQQQKKNGSRSSVLTNCNTMYGKHVCVCVLRHHSNKGKGRQREGTKRKRRNQVTATANCSGSTSTSEDDSSSSHGRVCALEPLKDYQKQQNQCALLLQHLRKRGEPECWRKKREGGLNQNKRPTIRRQLECVVQCSSHMLMMVMMMLTGLQRKEEKSREMLLQKNKCSQ